jgi:hypothetical protein
MYYKLLLPFCLFFFTIGVQSQLTPGEWRDHLPYKRASKTVVVNDRVYCSTHNSLYYYDKTDNSINTISKVQGLTEASIATIGYSESSEVLIIVYEDLNIDFLHNNKIENFPYVKNKTGLTNKKFNDLTVYKNKIYLSCGFGIVVIDLDKKIVLETYYPGSDGKTESIIDLAIDEKYIYAASLNNIYRSNSNDPFLVDNSRWKLLKSFSPPSTIKAIESFQDSLFVLMAGQSWASDYVLFFDGTGWQRANVPYEIFKSMTVANNKLIVTGRRIYQLDANLNLCYSYNSDFFEYANFTTCDKENTLWVADGFQSMIRIKSDHTIDTIKPNSPIFVEDMKIDVLDDQVWSVAGGIKSTWGKLYSRNGVAGFYNNVWHTFSGWFDSELENISDIVNVKINPYNTSQVYFTSWSGGLLKFENGHFTQYTEDNKNSTIKRNKDWYDGGFMVYGLAFDNDQNLWVTNSRTTKPLSVKTKSGKWYSFSLPYVSSNYYQVSDIIVTSWGHKWILSPKASTMIIYDDNNTPENGSDDISTTMNLSSLVSDGNALVASTSIYCITEDREGNIWVGTDAGPVEITGAQNVFEESGASARKIKVPLNIGEGLAAFLLETERINAIAVDGGNRKWIGTQNSGAYLVSADGTKQIAHFTAENSPLLSNTISDIRINNKTGEIYFATEKGLISYRGYSTEGNSEFGDVYVFPNPVREDFDGDIIVTNLLTDAIVKITDISGNLVYETKAIGGQAVWNGKNLLGDRVNTGVYLVFCSNDDGTKTYVTKLLFIH